MLGIRKTALALILTAGGLGFGCGSGGDSASEVAQGWGGNQYEPTCDDSSESPTCEPPDHFSPKPPKHDHDHHDDSCFINPPPAVCAFTNYNLGLVGGQISDVAYDARSPGVAWAAAGPRLFKSTNHGASWTMVYEGSIFGFRKLAIPPGDPKVLLAATSSGIARSGDGGVTWTIRGLSGLSVTSILVHPAQPLRVYAGIRGAGIVRSNDGGLTWSSIDYSMPYGDFPSMTADPSNPDIFLVAAFETNALNVLIKSVILRTTNAGASWTRVQENPDSYTYELATCAANPNVMYASASSYYADKVAGVLRSNDRGVTWTNTGGLNHALVQDVAIAPTDCDAIYAVHYGTGMKRSANGGATFSGPLTSGIPFYNNFPRHVAVDPANTARIIGASHAGLLYSADGGDHFSVVGGVMNLAVRSLAVSPTDPNRLWMATWGSGIWRRPSAEVPWEKAPLNIDYAFNVSPDPAVASRTIVGTWSYPFQTTDGAGFTMAAVHPNPMAFAFDPSSPDTVYMGSQISGIYKSTNGGGAWAPSNGALTPWDTTNGLFIDVRAVLVDATASNRVLAGTNLRGIYRSENHGSSWTQVAPSLAEKLVQCLVQAPDGAVYACVPGSGVAKSTDHGATFTYVNQGLPSLNVQAVVTDPVTGKLYSSSNLGVYQSSDGGANWEALDSACLPPDGAGPMAILGSGSSRLLVVGTGRGIFSHEL